MNTAKNITTFNLGQVVCTSNINNDVSNNEIFAFEVMKALSQYQLCQWGNTCPEDAKANDDAIMYGDSVLAEYSTSKGTIWIQTEWDRSCTTILYPDEY